VDVTMEDVTRMYDAEVKDILSALLGGWFLIAGIVMLRKNRN
jgi:hypothetical protein